MISIVTASGRDHVTKRDNCATRTSKYTVSIFSKVTNGDASIHFLLRVPFTTERPSF